MEPKDPLEFPSWTEWMVELDRDRRAAARAPKTNHDAPDIDALSTGSSSSTSCTSSSAEKAADPPEPPKSAKAKLKTWDHSKFGDQVDAIYAVIDSLYDEEIVPTVHEIRRKLNKIYEYDIDGQHLINLCMADPRFRMARIPGRFLNPRDIQRDRSIVIKDRPSPDFPTEVDDELLRVVSEYLVYISSNEYRVLSDAYARGAEVALGECDETGPKYGIDYVHIEKILNVGGRYLFAEHLKHHGPRQLRELPLGRIVNLIQRLYDDHELIYRGHCLVPLVTSPIFARRLLLNMARGCEADSLAGARRNIAAMLEVTPKIPLSMFPLVYRRTFNEDLNYADVGYDKLSDFIRAEVSFCRLSSEAGQCMVELEKPPEGAAPDTSPGDEAGGGLSSPPPAPTPSVPSQSLVPRHATVLYPLKLTRNNVP